MAMDVRTAFHSLVELVFNNWTALQLAVEHGMGGPQGKLAASQFVDYITDTFCQKADIEVEEVEDLLMDVLDSEFNTMCEDASPQEVARELSRLFVLCREGQTQQLEVEAAQLRRQPASKLWLSRPLPEQPQQQQQQQGENPEDSQETSPPPQLMETDPDDGWTVVKRK